MVMAKPKPPIDHEPIAGPTAQTRTHGAYERQRYMDGKVERKRWTNLDSWLLAMLERRGTITLQQARAGERFSEDHLLVWGPPSTGKDSCVLRVGGVAHETIAHAERIASAKQRMHRILNCCGPEAYSKLRQVAVYEQRLGMADRNKAKYAALRLGLDAAAKVYGIPDYRDTW